MISQDTLMTLVTDYGLAILAPLAVLEGPIVSVLGGWLAGRGVMVVQAVFLCVVIADVAGDSVLYGIGRYGGPRVPQRWREKLGLSRDRQAALIGQIHAGGGRLLVIGKLTHAMGFAVLAAAGAARYPFVRFLGVNLLATLPKSAALVGLGWALGDSWDRADAWLTRIVLIGALLSVVALTWWLRRAPRPA